MSGFDPGDNVYEKVYPRPWVGAAADWGARERVFLYLETIVYNGVTTLSIMTQNALDREIRQQPPP